MSFTLASFFLFTWVGNLFHNFKVKIVPVAVTILEAVKGAEDNGVVDAITKALDSAFGTKLFEAGNAILVAGITKALAAFLAIEDLPATPTEADITKFSQDVLTAIADKKATDSIPGQTYSNLVAQIYTALDALITHVKADGGKVTAGEIISAAETVYQQYLTDKANAEANAAE